MEKYQQAVLPQVKSKGSAHLYNEVFHRMVNVLREGAALLRTFQNFHSRS